MPRPPHTDENHSSHKVQSAELTVRSGSSHSGHPLTIYADYSVWDETSSSFCDPVNDFVRPPGV